MLRTFWKFRLIVILAALVLVAGGAIAVAAKEGTFSNSSHSASSGDAVQNNEGGQQNQEPTQTPKPPEPTPTHGVEPTHVPHTDVAGKITGVDCAGGSITINEDNNGGSFTASLTGNTIYTISGKSGTCSDLKVGWHVTIEAVQLSEGVWTAEHVSQDDSGQTSGGGSGGDNTPTPGPGGGDTTPTPAPNR